MRFRIVSDSSSNLFHMDEVDYTTVPLKITVANREYADVPGMNVAHMVEDLKTFKGKTSSSCPNVQEWLDAFADADFVFGVTISKNLSGSYNAAAQAAAEYTRLHPERRAYIFDSLSAGPEMAMIAEKLRTLIKEGLDFDAIRDRVLEYHNRLHTLFCLESLTNLARNGRVNPAVAKIAGVLGIRVVGDAKGGQLAPSHKPRGERKAIATLVEMLQERGLTNESLVRIAHCFAPEQANALKEAVLAKLPGCRFLLEPTAGLCSYYAEVGGLIVGFEGGYNTHNNNKDF